MKRKRGREDWQVWVWSVAAQQQETALLGDQLILSSCELLRRFSTLLRNCLSTGSAATRREGGVAHTHTHIQSVAVLAFT